MWESTVGRRLAERGEWDDSADVHLLVPGGLGDFHWIWTKLAGWARARRVRFWVAGGDAGATRRGAAFARLCGADAVDDPALTTDAVWAMPGSPRLPERGIAAVQANRHLEAGRGLESWYPEFPARHGYPLAVPEWAAARAAALLAPAGPKAVALFTGGADYMGGQHAPEEWARLGRAVLATWSAAGLVLVGAARDVPHAARVAALLPEGRRACVFDQPVEVLVAVLRRCAAFVGAAGGPGIIGTSFGLPAALFYPGHLAAMPGTWEPPDLLAAGDCPWALMKELPTCREMPFPMLQRALAGRAPARCAAPGGGPGPWWRA